MHLPNGLRENGFTQGNHVQLAEEGVISALIDLAKTECPVVRRNCASAMRSMTCKAEIRQLLIASGAIKVILDDATNQVIDFEKSCPPQRVRAFCVLATILCALSHASMYEHRRFPHRQ